MSRWREIMAGPSAIQAREEQEEFNVGSEDPASSPDQSLQWGQRAQRSKPTGKANRLAVFALFCAFTVPILGIVFGVVALDEIRASKGTERGRGMAQWAICLGVVVLAMFIAFAILLATR